MATRIEADGHIVFEDGSLFIHNGDNTQVIEIRSIGGSFILSLPSTVSPIGLKSLLRITDEGGIEVQEPRPYIVPFAAPVINNPFSQPNVQSAIDDITTRLNDLQNILIAANILHTSSQLITPKDHPGVALQTDHTTPIIPDAAEVAFDTLIQTPPELALATVDPTVVIS